MRLLREREFRNFWLGQSVSLFGDQITYVALPLAAVLVLDAGPAQMGYLGAAALLPHLLLSLPAGVWLDRVARRKRVMIGADLGRAALLATIPLAYGRDALTLGQLYAVAFLTGCLAVLFDLSYPTLFVSVAPRERYVEGNSLIHGSRSFSLVGGPTVSGFLVQVCESHPDAPTSCSIAHFAPPSRSGFSQRSAMNSPLARVIAAYGMSRQLLGIKINLAQVAARIPLRLIVEVS